MSYEPDPHPAQMQVLRYLLLSQGANFAALQKITGMQSDQFTFHLKKLIKAGYVCKQRATYLLTSAGKEYANRVGSDDTVSNRQAKISIIVIVEDDAGRILYQQRLKHPYYGYWGHISCKISQGEKLIEAGASGLIKEANLKADLRIVGFYHKMDYTDSGGHLLEDKLLCIIHGTNPRGELIVDAPDRHNQWMNEEEYSRLEKSFGDIKETESLIHGKHQVILENKYYYSADDY